LIEICNLAEKISKFTDFPSKTLIFWGKMELFLLSFMATTIEENTVNEQILKKFAHIFKLKREIFSRNDAKSVYLG